MSEIHLNPSDHILWKSFIIGKHCSHIFVTTVMENENISSFFYQQLNIVTFAQHAETIAYQHSTILQLLVIAG